MYNISYFLPQKTVTWKLEQNNEDNDNPTYTLTISGTGAMSDFVIKPTDLRPWGGEYCGKITQINLSEGITVIGSYAFCRLTNLESCEIPASIIEIKNDAFSGAGFTNLAFEKNCQLKTIGNGAFYGSSNLEIDFVIPDSVESIGNLAFQGSGIKSLTIGSGVKNIGGSAFSACSNLTEELNIPDGVKSIGGNAFNSSPIKSVTFGSGIENIGGNAFLRSAGQDKVALVKHEFVVTDKMKEIQNSTFAGLDVSVLKIEAGSETTFKPYSVAHLSNQIHSVVFLSDTYPSFEANSFQNTVLSIIYGRSNSVKEALKAVMPSGTSANTIYAITKGGTFEVGTSFEAGKLATPTKEGSIFEGWYDNAQFTANKVTTAESGKTYYAKWIELKDQSISMEYGSTKELPTVSGVTLSEWTSADESVAKVENGKIKTVNAGKTTLTAKASTASGGTATFTVNVEVTPMSIIYGSPDKTEDGRPYIAYSLNEDGTAPKISDILGFYPVKEKQGESGYEADTSKPKITLNPSMGADGDVEYTYVNDVSNNKITTDTLPTHPTVDENGNPHSIRVEMKLKNPNYRFTTIGTNWQQGDTITLFVTCYEEGMNEVDMYLEGESKPLKIFEEQVYEYTGQGVVPTTKDLTTLYTKGKNTSNTITKFTAHFHAVAEDTKFAGSHLEQVTNDQLTKEALEKIAPKELGVYSFVINGYNKDTKTYSYVSRRYSIVKGKPTGNPVFDVIESGKSLSEVQLSGTMKNKIGETVAGTFTWEDGNQTVESGKAYKWTFTPDDTNHYEVVNGESIVCPIPMEELNAIPTINASDKTLTVGDTFNPLEGVTASDKEDGDITEKVEVLSNDVDTSKAGTYTVIYKVTDSKGASSTKTITVTVKAKDTQNPTTDDSKKPSATDTDKKPASTDKQTTSNSPKTGDSTNMTTWLALMFVSLGLLAGVFTVRKSRKSR